MPVLLHAHPAIGFIYDPVLLIGGVAVRAEVVGAVLAIALGIVAAAIMAGGTPIRLEHPARWFDEASGELNHLRRDDLLYITVAAFPGAVVGGRLGYALIHLDYFTANPGLLWDIGHGGFELALGVVGGVVTAAIVAGLLGAPLGRWLHALILPLLLTLAVAKLAMASGGAGQGVPFDGDWATSYLGDGPWDSLAPAIPSHPAQLYEAAATGLVALVLLVLMAARRFNRRNGAAFLLGITLWAIARAAVASLWRDPVVAAGLRMEQLVCIAIAFLAGLALVIVVGLGIARRMDGAETSA